MNPIKRTIAKMLQIILNIIMLIRFSSSEKNRDFLIKKLGIRLYEMHIYNISCNKKNNIKYYHECFKCHFIPCSFYFNLCCILIRLLFATSILVWVIQYYYTCSVWIWILLRRPIQVSLVSLEKSQRCYNTNLSLFF